MKEEKVRHPLPVLNVREIEPRRCCGTCGWLAFNTSSASEPTCVHPNGPSWGDSEEDHRWSQATPERIIKASQLIDEIGAAE